MLEDAVNAKAPRFDWTKDEIREIYNTPLMELAFQSVGKRLNCWWGGYLLIDGRVHSTDAFTRRQRCRCARL